MAEAKNELVVFDREQYALLNFDQEDLQEILDESLGGEMTLSDLQKTGVPGGGSTFFTLIDENGEEDEVKSFEGIIVGQKHAKAYWEKSFDETGGGELPDCSSDDKVQGIGFRPGVDKQPDDFDPENPPRFVHDCASCPFNEFGSAKGSGEGKACKDFNTLFVIRTGDVLPIRVNVPATSLKPVKQYLINLASRGKGFYSVVTRFELEKAKSNSGIAYAKIKLSKASDIDKETNKELKAYKDSVKGLIASFSASDLASSPSDSSNSQDPEYSGNDPFEKE